MSAGKRSVTVTADKLIVDKETTAASTPLHSSKASKKKTSILELDEPAINRAYCNESILKRYVQSYICPHSESNHL